jgi:hypothetical protein
MLALVERVRVGLGAQGVAAPGGDEGAVQQPELLGGCLQGVGQEGVCDVAKPLAVGVVMRLNTPAAKGLRWFPIPPRSTCPTSWSSTCLG